MFALLTSCNSDTELATDNNTKISTQSKTSFRTEEVPISRKVANTFNVIVQNEEAWKSLKNVFEDDIVMRTQFVTEDHVMLSARIIKDDVLPKTEFIIKDDVFIGKTTFSETFTGIYNHLYPSDKISYELILQKLPKLHFAAPKLALEDYNTWKEKGFPIVVKSYNNENNNLSKIDKEKVVNIIGSENYEKLITTSKISNPNFYLSKTNEAIVIIAAKANKGGIVKIENEQTKIASFQIEDKGHYNNIVVNENSLTTTMKQSNMLTQAYLDVFIPNSCNGFYVYNCGSPALETYLQNKQQLANKTCETNGVCLPICCDGSIMWVMYQFVPNSIKCKKVMDYVTELSMYSMLTPIE